MDAPIPEPAKKAVLSTEQKIAFVLLLFFGIGGTALGFTSFGANLRRPFDIQLAKAPEYAPLEVKESKELEAMKTRDTDGDRLSDYDELMVYKTSSYLKDSDSDGFDDKMEVFSGNDPNCPKDKVCNAPVASTEVAGEPPALVLEEDSGAGANLADALPKASDVFANEGELKAFLNQLSPDEIRAFLVQSGVAEETLKNLTDDQVKQVFAKAVDQASKEGKLSSILDQASQKN